MRLPRHRTGRLAGVAVGLLGAAVLLAGCSSAGTTPAASPTPGKSSPATQTGSASSAGSVSTPPASNQPSMPPSTPAGPPQVSVATLSWQLPGVVAREAAAVVSGSIVIAGGLVPGDVSVDHAWRIDPATGAVTALSSLPHAVHDVAGAALGGNLLAIGGGRSTVYGYVQRVGPPGASAVIGALPVPRADVAAVGTARGVVVVGGYDGNTLQAAVLLSSDGRSFSTVATLPEPVRYPAVVASGDMVWIVGGEVSGHQVNVVQQVDLANGKAQVVARLPFAIGHAAAAYVDGGLLVAGGRTNSGISAEVSWLDLHTGQTSSVGKLPMPIADSGFVTLGQRLLLLGGETPAYSNRVVAVSWGRPAG